MKTLLSENLYMLIYATFIAGLIIICCTIG